MKRIFDVLVSGTMLLLLSPLLAVISLLVYIKLGSPVLFRQERPGKNGQPFYLVKFRSMLDVMDCDGKMLPDEFRMTPLGSFLRSSSLDELPDLLNVLKGEMSLVGPRPLLMRYLPLYTEEQFRRHEVLPGITGWAQVKGRNSISWEERFLLDVWYVDNQSFFLDMKILWMTLGTVLKREGVSAEGYSTMPEFTGKE